MWISKAHYLTMNGLIESSQNRNTEMLRREGAVLQKVSDLERENIRMRADIDWFKLRLNSVERERAQLIFAATGQKISVPEFVPTYDAPETALAEQPDFAAVGEDARSDADYSMMPERAHN